jgi:hypothetical protein
MMFRPLFLNDRGIDAIVPWFLAGSLFPWVSIGLCSRSAMR